MTGYGDVTNFTVEIQQQVNLTQLIVDGLRASMQSRPVRRDLKCYTNDQYAMTGGGYWHESWVKEGGCYTNVNHAGTPQTAWYRLSSFPAVPNIGGAPDDMIFNTFSTAGMD